MPKGGNPLNKVQRVALIEEHNLALPQMNLPTLTEMLRFYNKSLTGVIELRDDFFGASTTLEEIEAARNEPLLRWYTVVVNNRAAQEENRKLAIEKKLNYDPQELVDAIYLVQDVGEGPEVDKKWYPILIRGLNPANCLKHQSEAQTFERLKEALEPPATSTVSIPSP